MEYMERRVNSKEALPYSRILKRYYVDMLEGRKKMPSPRETENFIVQLNSMLKETRESEALLKIA